MSNSEANPAHTMVFKQIDKMFPFFFATDSCFTEQDDINLTSVSLMADMKCDQNTLEHDKCIDFAVRRFTG